MRLLWKLLFFLPFCGLSAESIDLTNDLVKVSVYSESAAGLAFSTISGDLYVNGDDNQSILLKTDPPTCITAIQIDGTTFIYGSSAGYYKLRPAIQNNKIISAWSVQGLVFQQAIELTEGPTTGSQDNFKIIYTVLNDSDKTHKIAFEMIFDNYIGSDNTAFYSQNTGKKILNETSFSGKDIPDYWFAWDRADGGGLKIQGTLKYPGLNAPDQVYFSEWPHLYDNLWNFKPDGHTLKKGKDLDTAAGLVYSAKELLKGQTMSVSTMYGLYGISSFNSNDMEVFFTGPGSINQFPFRFTINISNHTGYNISELSVSALLPDNVIIDSQSPNQEKTVFHNLKPYGSQSIEYFMDSPNLKKEKKETEIPFSIQGRIGSLFAQTSFSHKILLDGTKPFNRVSIKTLAVINPDKLWESYTASGDLIISGFAYKSYKLTSNMKIRLDRIVQVIKAFPKPIRFKITGFTDAFGGPDFNQKLSEQRALSVYNYLVDFKKLPADRFDITNQGAENPLVDNTKPEETGKNRRVEITKLP